MNMPVLSIIIVNWNSIQFTIQCIQSILKHANSIPLEIIVVDNASNDDCGSILLKKYQFVKFIQNTVNGGFAQANNLGAKYANSQNILFLNPDTELVSSALNVIINSLLTLPKVGVVGVKLLNSDKSVQTSCLQSFPTLCNQLLDCDILRNCLPRSSLWGMAALYTNIDNPTEVDVVSGACLGIKRETFDRIGGFSEEYFMYSEDVDICYKCRNKGLKNYFLPDVTVIHYGGGSSSKKEISSFSAVMCRESRLRYFKKTKGFPYAILYRTCIGIIASLRMLVSIILIMMIQHAEARQRWRNAFLKSKAIFKWALGLEKWLSKYK